MIETEDGVLLADPEVYADLVASAARDVSFSPSVVTEALGLSPTTTRRVGEPGLRGEPSRFAWWSLRVFPKQTAFYADDVVRVALEPLAGKAEAVTALQLEGIRFRLSLVVETHVACDSGGDPTVFDMYLGLSGQSIASLAALSVAYDVSQQFWP